VPSAKAHGWPHGGPTPLVSWAGATRLSAMTLSEIVSAAPVALPAARGGIRIPPPAAIAGSGVDELRPSRIATRLIETVGFAIPSPIVITGPPPRMTVAAADTPTSRTLFVIVIPPANAPCPIEMVSPAPAAACAAWRVWKQFGLW